MHATEVRRNEEYEISASILTGTFFLHGGKVVVPLAPAAVSLSLLREAKTKCDKDLHKKGEDFLILFLASGEWRNKWQGQVEKSSLDREFLFYLLGQIETLLPNGELKNQCFLSRLTLIVKSEKFEKALVEQSSKTAVNLYLGAAEFGAATLLAQTPCASLPKEIQFLYNYYVDKIKVTRLASGHLRSFVVQGTRLASGHLKRFLLSGKVGKSELVEIISLLFGSVTDGEWQKKAKDYWSQEMITSAEKIIS